jgi:hypothetical protein
VNVLKFRKPPESQPPRVKRKPRARLRVVQTERDIRIPKSTFDAGLSRFLAKLRECYEYVDVLKDGHRASIFVAPTIRDIPRYAYVVRKKDSAIVDMSGCKRGKVVGNVVSRGRLAR